MRRYLAPLTIGLTLASALLALSRHEADSTAASGPSLNIIAPENASANLDLTVPPPLIQTSAEEKFDAFSGQLPVHAPDQQPVAQLISVPPGLQGEILTLFPPQAPPAAADEIAYDMLSTVEYHGAARFTITTSQPSAAAAQRTMLLGNQTLELDGGKRVWKLDSEYDAKAPNQLAWSEGGLIITVASDLSLKELLELVKNIQIIQ